MGSIPAPGTLKLKLVPKGQRVRFMYKSMLYDCIVEGPGNLVVTDPRGVACWTMLIRREGHDAEEVPETLACTIVR